MLYATGKLSSPKLNVNSSEILFSLLYTICNPFPGITKTTVEFSLQKVIHCLIVYYYSSSMEVPKNSSTICNWID